MYGTRPLSLYRKNPSALSLEPPDIPHSGILVIKDEESEEQDAYCWGMCDHKKIKSLPFPQNKILSIVHSSDATGSVTRVWFLPVLNQPLCSNMYYIIRAEGKYKGKAFISSKKVDICSCWCLPTLINDRKPRLLDCSDVYQQFEIKRYHGGGFYAKSVASDGVPPSFLRRKGWEVRVSRSVRAELKDAEDLNDSVQATIPTMRRSFPTVPANERRPAVVGRWYVPFALVQEVAKLKRHMKKSILYELTLEQYWEEFYSRENNGGNEEPENDVRVIGNVQMEQILIYGMEAKKEADFVSGFVWFKAANDTNQWRRLKLGLGLAVVENMMGIQEERGWTGGVGCEEDMDVRVERMEEVRSGGNNNDNIREWRRLGYYVLVESFYLRRIDGILIMKYIFRHVHRIQAKWE